MLLVTSGEMPFMIEKFPNKKMSFEYIGIFAADSEAVRTASRVAELEKQRVPIEPEKPKEPENRKHVV